MTPTDEATFIALWNAGTETAAIARQLGLKPTTAQSRAYRLQQQGLIQPRPRGGNYPTDRVKARAPAEGGLSTVHHEPSTVDRPPSTVDPIPSTVHPLQEDLTAALTAALQPVLARLEALETGLARQPHDYRPPSTLTPWTVHRLTVHRLPSTLTPGS